MAIEKIQEINNLLRIILSAMISCLQFGQHLQKRSKIENHSRFIWFLRLHVYAIKHCGRKKLKSSTAKFWAADFTAMRIKFLVEIDSLLSSSQCGSVFALKYAQSFSYKCIGDEPFNSSATWKERNAEHSHNAQCHPHSVNLQSE